MDVRMGLRVAEGFATSARPHTDVHFVHNLFPRASA